MNRLTILFAALILFAFSTHAGAQESLNFRTPDGIKELRLIQHIQKNAQAPDIQYNIASVDINDDLVNEFIINPAFKQKCAQGRLCPYYVIALQERHPITLGKFNAHKVVVSSKKTYGIQNIIVYNDLYNDFKSQTLVWHPYEFKYK